MQSPEVLANRVRAGWSNLLARAAAAILMFELVSGLAITLGPFHPAMEWSLLLHTIVGVITIAPIVWYCARHWKDYSDQALTLIENQPIRVNECRWR